jgi:hypothetical protein
MAAPNLKHGQVVASITVKVFADNAMSVEGNIEDPNWATAALANAIDAIRNQTKPKLGLIIPGKDVSL